MRTIFWTLISLLISLSAMAAPVLIEETGPARTMPSLKSNSRVREESSSTSFLRRPGTLRDVFKPGEYTNAETLRKDRRLGVGVETFGRYGVVGIGFEMNFTALDSATAGFGGGPGYNSVGLGWKHLFGGEALSPYAGFGVARWTGTSKTRVMDSNPRYLESKFLDDKEKNSGQFGKNFLVPSLGLQLNKLRGPSSGAVLFGEIVLLIEASTMAQVPTAAFGAMYFF